MHLPEDNSRNSLLEIGKQLKLEATWKKFCPFLYIMQEHLREFPFFVYYSSRWNEMKISLKEYVELKYLKVNLTTNTHNRHSWWVWWTLVFKDNEMYPKCSDLRFCVRQIQRPTKNDKFQNFPHKKYISIGSKLLLHPGTYIIVYIFI